MNAFSTLFIVCILLLVLCWTPQGQEDEDVTTKQRKVVRNDRYTKLNGDSIAKHTVKAGRSDSCDWKVNPMANIRGHLCGSHYKVLGLNRLAGTIDKISIRKAYRQMSLAVHPDKNPSSDAEEAFQLIQQAYECLSDDKCREDYDSQIQFKEGEMQVRRAEKKQKILKSILKITSSAYHYTLFSAFYINQVAERLWEWAGELTVQISDYEIPFGRGAIALLLFSRTGRAIILVQCICSIVSKLPRRLSDSSQF